MIYIYIIVDDFCFVDYQVFVCYYIFYIICSNDFLFFIYNVLGSNKLGMGRVIQVVGDIIFRVFFRVGLIYFGLDCFENSIKNYKY